MLREKREMKVYVVRSLVRVDAYGLPLIVNALEDLVDFCLLNKLRIPVNRRRRLVAKLQALAERWGRNLEKPQQQVTHLNTEG